jgi:hypothetical protein
MLGKARTLKMVRHPLWGKRIGDKVSEDDVVLRGGRREMPGKLYALLLTYYIHDSIL